MTRNWAAPSRPSPFFSGFCSWCGWVAILSPALLPLKTPSSGEVNLLQTYHIAHVTQKELEKKNVLKLLSQDVFIANPSGGLHKSEVPQKHAP